MEAPRGRAGLSFPPGFFDRMDPAPDAGFYAAPRLVTHIDDDAIAAVGALYEELGVEGRVLDLMGSWVSHFTAPPPQELVVLGMNEPELRANAAAAEIVVQDLNADASLPFDAGSFDHVVCCVSIDYLTRPLEVFAEVATLCTPEGCSSSRSPTAASPPRRSADGCRPTTPVTWPTSGACSP